MRLAVVSGTNSRKAPSGYSKSLPMIAPMQPTSRSHAMAGSTHGAAMTPMSDRSTVGHSGSSCAAAPRGPAASSTTPSAAAARKRRAHRDSLDEEDVDMFGGGCVRVCVRMPMGSLARAHAGKSEEGGERPDVGSKAEHLFTGCCSFSFEKVRG